ncbi:hypothetical protein O0882_28145 [Janthinobacterium sp. SUN073]|uniref:hypothetical protein n=1 Tax=Janthinobacterium sp. SUN073 TaxID=3004102 RepID=UPI0025AFD85C|nr:hypothetical protein [Janthinobacterium sp. SUN073]MDN2700188.1 hypothetical protein [Janthinobacterium sp. SUN073]
MGITTPLVNEILQHFARVFPMPGRIDGREDYLALVNIWADQLEPYTDEQVKDACHRVMGKLKRFPYPSDVRDELAPASAASTTVASLSIEVDTRSIDAAVAKVEHLKEKICVGADRDCQPQLIYTLGLILEESKRTNEMLSQFAKAKKTEQLVTASL